MKDKPYDLPPPSIVADLCAQRAWADDIDDDTRLLLEWAADTITGSKLERGRALGRAERLEAVCEVLKHQPKE